MGGQSQPLNSGWSGRARAWRAHGTPRTRWRVLTAGLPRGPLRSMALSGLARRSLSRSAGRSPVSGGVAMPLFAALRSAGPPSLRPQWHTRACATSRPPHSTLSVVVPSPVGGLPSDHPFQFRLPPACPSVRVPVGHPKTWAPAHIAHALCALPAKLTSTRNCVALPISGAEDPQTPPATP